MTEESTETVEKQAPVEPVEVAEAAKKDGPSRGLRVVRVMERSRLARVIVGGLSVGVGIGLVMLAVGVAPNGQNSPFNDQALPAASTPTQPDSSISGTATTDSIVATPPSAEPTPTDALPSPGPSAPKSAVPSPVSVDVGYFNKATRDSRAESIPACVKADGLTAIVFVGDDSVAGTEFSINVSLTGVKNSEQIQRSISRCIERGAQWVVINAEGSCPDAAAGDQPTKSVCTESGSVASTDAPAVATGSSGAIDAATTPAP